jgi:hypothetical protein
LLLAFVCVRYQLLVPLLLNELQHQRDINTNQADERRKLSARIETLLQRQGKDARKF